MKFKIDKQLIIKRLEHIIYFFSRRPLLKKNIAPGFFETDPYNNAWNSNSPFFKKL